MYDCLVTAFGATQAPTFGASSSAFGGSTSTPAFGNPLFSIGGLFEFRNGCVVMPPPCTPDVGELDIVQSRFVLQV